jgi:hypothetical protein
MNKPITIVTGARKQPNLFVATPMYGGMCNGLYTLGMIGMVGAFGNSGISYRFAYMMNESLITRGRNALAHDFLDTDATHMMFIDADIGFDAHDIIKMIQADKDIICGIYPKKEINWPQVERAVKAGVPMEELGNHVGAFVVNLVGGAAEAVTKLSEPLEISNGGTGFMLIKREVFEALADKVPEYANDMYLATEVDRKPKIIKEFFATSIDPEEGNRLLSEDYHFCKIARKAGFRVWAAPWAQLTHCGTYNFSGALPKVNDE